MTNKYNRTITNVAGESIVIDVYDCLRAFNITDPALQHGLKKLLCMGLRGHKDLTTDLNEAIESLQKMKRFLENNK